MITRAPTPQTPEQIAAQWGSAGAASLTGNADAARDELIAQYAQTTDVYESRELLAQIEATIVQAAVALPLAVNPQVTVINRGVTGVATPGGDAALRSAARRSGKPRHERRRVGCSPHRDPSVATLRVSCGGVAVGMMLPNELVWVMEKLGFEWPDIDEDEVRKGAVLVRNLGTDLEDVIQAVDRKVNGDISGGDAGSDGAGDVGRVEHQPFSESAEAGRHHAAGGDRDGYRG